MAHNMMKGTASMQGRIQRANTFVDDQYRCEPTWPSLSSNSFGNKPTCWSAGSSAATLPLLLPASPLGPSAVTRCATDLPSTSDRLEANEEAARSSKSSLISTRCYVAMLPRCPSVAREPRRNRSKGFTQRKAFIWNAMRRDAHARCSRGSRGKKEVRAFWSRQAVRHEREAYTGARCLW